MTDVLNPVDIERHIRGISDRIARGVPIVSKSYADYLRLDGEYDRAFARAYMAHDGPAHEKKYAAELATENERNARDLADVAHRHAKDQADALREELRAYQSVGASVRAMYAVAGRGE
ncbi:hypothetical protein [Nocardioides sp.]|uniref:hypothetical protein n=1 Tax=Nocardioides sp. TaxID=35761 RepID=UPI0039E47719